MDAQIDVYLDAICAGLPSEAPAEAVQDMRREMRGHLQAAVIAGQELGNSPEQALEHALAQFGKPHVVARQWQEEWETTLTETKAVSFWPSLKLALKVWTVMTVATLIIGFLIRTVSLLKGEATVFSILTLTAFFAPPLIAGTIIGLRTRRHPVLATLAGYALLLPVLLIGFIGLNVWQVSYTGWLTAKTVSHPFGYYVGTGIQGVLSFLPLWIILSLFSSGTVTIARRFQTRRRQIAR